MKNSKKLLSLLLALVMMVGVFAPLTVLAAENDGTVVFKINTKVEIEEKNNETGNTEKKEVFAGSLSATGVTAAESETERTITFKTDSTKTLTENKVVEPTVTPIAGYYFKGWDKKVDLNSKPGTGETVYIAKIAKTPTGKLDKEQLSPTKPDTTEIDIYKLVTKENYNEGAPWKHTGGKIDPDAQTTDKYTTLGKGVEALKGAKFSFYKINGADDVENEKILELLKANSDKFKTVEDMETLMKSGATGLKVSAADKTMTSIAAGKIKLAEGTGLTKVEYGSNDPATYKAETAATGTDGKTTVKLAEGYYWVVESEIPEKVTGQIAVPFGLTLPLTNIEDVKDGDKTIEAGTQYLKKLYIYPKNLQTDKVQIDKDHANYDESKGIWVDKDGKKVEDKDLGIDYTNYQREKKTVSRQLHQNSPFQSDTTIPRNYTFDEFSWVDTMSEGLTYNKDLVVTIDYIDEDGTTKKTNEPFINALNKAKFVTERDNGFDIKVTKDQVTDTLVEYLKRGPVTFHFSYSATVNENAAVDKPQSNSITFKPGEPTGVPDVKSEDGKIEIVKSWKKNNADVTPTATDLTYYVEDANGKTVASVTVKSDATAGTKIDAGKGITFTVGANFGSGTFEGLPEGTYKVREAVNGYEPTYTADDTNGKLTIENNDKPEVKKPSEPTVVFHGKKFVKMDQLGNETRLFGAEFVIRRAAKEGYEYLVVKNDTQKVEEVQAVKDAKKALDDKIAEYNKLSAEEQKEQKSTYDTAIDGLQKTYNDAVIKANKKYTWEEGTGTGKNTPPENAYKLVSDEEGRFEITGLSEGKYELVEVKAPEGYALNSNPVPFEVKDGTYKADTSEKAIHYNKDAKADDPKDALRVDNKKLTIPQTGGIGTVIFTVVGIALMAGAVIAMKKNRKEA